MNWIRGDKYFLTSDEFNICVVNLPHTRRYELWRKKGTECLASAIAAGEEAERKAIKHLQEIAEAC